MYNIKFDNGLSLSVDQSEDGFIINDKKISWDEEYLPNGTYSVISNGKSYELFIEEINKANKSMSVNINGQVYHLQIEEPIDLLLKKMGINMSAANKAESIKAPMPGMVLKILVKEGDEIKKGEPVLILEAMKMENALKATYDATIKSIKVNEGVAVEKGTVLIELS